MKTSFLTVRSLSLILWVLLLPLSALGQANYATPYTFITLAGRAGSQGSADGTGSAARFYGPTGVAVDSAGNVYVTEYNSTIRKGIPVSLVPSPNLEAPSVSGGQFGFGITGLPGLAVNIESSVDLSHWQMFGTYVLEGGTNYFVNRVTPQGTRFYRGHAR